ncbi:unnamed protein product [Candidula unifasciata]|uniref:Secreted protein n=1 Tax=Candidula unifasciata TaxID=100452 RepID=A0A8S3YRE3_9EUPU|nr:unnamed protein product [Candidula unifasciata]
MLSRNWESASILTILHHPLQFVLICTLLMSSIAESSGVDTKEDRPIIREKRNARSRQASHSNDQLMDILNEYDTNNVDVNLLRYTPTTPSPEDVNCYVEVPVTRRVGGRCVLLGSSTWGCQAGIFLAFNSDCQSEATQQTPTQTPAASDDAASVTGQASTRTRNPFRRRRRPSRR